MLDRRKERNQYLADGVEMMGMDAGYVGSRLILTFFSTFGNGKWISNVDGETIGEACDVSWCTQEALSSHFSPSSFPIAPRHSSNQLRIHLNTPL